MTVRELTKQLLDFNPDAKVVARNGNNPSTDFVLAWGELNKNGMDKTKQSVVTIFVESENDEPQNEQMDSQYYTYTNCDIIFEEASKVDI